MKKFVGLAALAGVVGYYTYRRWQETNRPLAQAWSAATDPVA